MMEETLGDRVGRAVYRIIDRRELTSDRAARAAYTFALECLTDALDPDRLRTTEGAGAVDPHAASTGTPTPRVKEASSS